MRKTLSIVKMNHPSALDMKSLFDGAVYEGRFKERPLSWVCVVGEFFLKVPKFPAGSTLDADHPETLESVKQEYQACSLLHEKTPAVIRPLPLIPGLGCLFSAFVRGRDLLDILRNEEMSIEQRDDLLEDGVGICAAWHDVESQSISGISEYDYAASPFLKLSESELEVIRKSRKTLISQGFEVRNLRYSSEDGNVRFFDPHILNWGMAEEDFARFIVSLLMLNWKTRRPWIWKRFQLNRLLSSYESISVKPLSRDVLELAFRHVVAMREYHGKKRVSIAAAWIRPVMSFYCYAYFRQMRSWIKSNATGL